MLRILKHSYNTHGKVLLNFDLTSNFRVLRYTNNTIQPLEFNHKRTYSLKELISICWYCKLLMSRFMICPLLSKRLLPFTSFCSSFLLVFYWNEFRIIYLKSSETKKGPMCNKTFHFNQEIDYFSLLLRKDKFETWAGFKRYNGLWLSLTAINYLETRAIKVSDFLEINNNSSKKLSLVR